MQESIAKAPLTENHLTSGCCCFISTEREFVTFQGVVYFHCQPPSPTQKFLQTFHQNLLLLQPESVV